MVDLGQRILHAARQQVRIRHPIVADFDTIEFCMFTDIESASDKTYRNATIMPPGRIDRSPCGTGSAARLAVMHAKGEIGFDETATMRSIIGSRFATRIVGATRVGELEAVLPTITGRAWIYSTGQYGVDQSDPFPEGFTLSDTWGEGIDHVIPHQ